MSITVHRAAVADLDPTVLYRILRLRVDVFVVEQRCAYPELDGRDLERDDCSIGSWPRSASAPASSTHSRI